METISLFYSFYFHKITDCLLYTTNFIPFFNMCNKIHSTCIRKTPNWQIPVVIARYLNKISAMNFCRNWISSIIDDTCTVCMRCHNEQTRNINQKISETSVSDTSNAMEIPYYNQSAFLSKDGNCPLSSATCTSTGVLFLTIKLADATFWDPKIKLNMI